MHLLQPFPFLLSVHNNVNESDAIMSCQTLNANCYHNNLHYNVDENKFELIMRVYTLMLILIRISYISETKQTRTEKDKDKDNTEGDQRLKKELREKSKLLEEKLKLLRTKEVEFRRVMLSKDKAAKEVTHST